MTAESQPCDIRRGAFLCADRQRIRFDTARRSPYISSAMNTREPLRTSLFNTLIPMPAESWPTDEADLFEAGMDSLRVMQLLVFVEDKLGVNLPDHEVTPERIGNV